MLDRTIQLRHTDVVKILPADSPVSGVLAGQDGPTRRSIVRLLLESPSITAVDIGRSLDLSAAGVRRHLDALVEGGDAEANPAAAWQHAGRGRPAKRYRLTGAGRAEQPGSAHADEFGPGQRRRLDVLVAVQPRNRRTQGELPGCHHYRTLSAVGRRPD